MQRIRLQNRALDFDQLSKSRPGSHFLLSFEGECFKKLAHLSIDKELYFVEKLTSFLKFQIQRDKLSWHLSVRYGFCLHIVLNWFGRNMAKSHTKQNILRNFVLHINHFKVNWAKLYCYLENHISKCSHSVHYYYCPYVARRKLSGRFSVTSTSPWKLASLCVISFFDLKHLRYKY